MSILWFILPGLLAAALAAAFTPVARALALRVGAVDLPGPRKIHQTPRARLGGLAVVAATATVFATSIALFSGRIHTLEARFLTGLTLGAIPILFVSIWDDIRPLSALTRFGAHLFGAVLAVSWGIRLGETIHLFGYGVTIGWLAIPLSILWLAGVTNAFNIIDGLDGLSAGLGFISAASLAAVSIVIGQYPMGIAASVVAGALAGFLPWNIHPAKIYLGDSGATAIGFALGCLTLGGGSTTTAGLAVALPLLVVGVPVADTLLSMARRIVRKFDGDDTAKVFGADRNHVHHRLLQLGYSHRRAVVTLYGAALLLALTGFASLFVNQQKAAVLLGTIVAAAAIGVVKLGYDEFAVVRRGILLRFYETPVLRTNLFIVFADMMMVAFAVWLAVGLKYDDWNLGARRGIAIQLASLLPACLILVFATMNIYRRRWRSASSEEVVHLGTAVVITGALAFVASRLFIDPPVPTSLLALTTVILLVLEPGVRVSYKVVFEMTRRAKCDGEPVLIYGAGKGGTLALRELLQNSDIPMRPVGFIDDDPEMAGKFINGFPVLGGVERLSALVTATGVNGVVVASAKIPIARRKEASDVCAERGVWIRHLTIGFGEGTEQEAPDAPKALV